jgi:hypothetical protein
MASMRVLAMALLLAACRGESALGRAQRAFGPETSVSGTGRVCGEGTVYTAVPDPVPPDDDSYDALLLAADGTRLAAGREVAFCHEAGVRDLMKLAQVAAIFVGDSKAVATEELRTATDIRGASQIEAPRLDGNVLTFWVVRGSMAPVADKVVVDVTTGNAALLDLEARYDVLENVQVAFGVNNVLDEYPNFTPGAINSPTGSIGFPGYSPFGFNGRFLYGRINVSW